MIFYITLDSKLLFNLTYILYLSLLLLGCKYSFYAYYTYLIRLILYLSLFYL